jgi:hypothetical protein
MTILSTDDQEIFFDPVEEPEIPKFLRNLAE